MLPVTLDLRRVEVALIGSGERTLGRLLALEAAGAAKVAVYAADPAPALRRRAGERLVTRWPAPAELDKAAIVFIADLPRSLAERHAAQARALRKPVNTEDQPDLCDFHMPAIVRRGDLVVAISTNGLAPGLAKRIKQFLSDFFGPEWSGRVAALGRARKSWRARGDNAALLARQTNRFIDERGWL